VKEKIRKLVSQLTKGLVERGEVVKIALLTLLAQENLILIGPPGTAKSEIARRLSQVIKEGSYFEYLLTERTTPEEILGPLSIGKFKPDSLNRNTAGYMPEVNIAFLDGIFNAESSTLNSLLTVINKKIFPNGRKKEDISLLSLVAASNELPASNNELNSLYDRFLVRKVVGYIKDENVDSLFEVKDNAINIADEFKFSAREVEKIKEEAASITIPDSIKVVIKDIRLDFKDEFENNSDEEISDRKFIKMMNLLRVSAFTNGREKVNYSDLILLKNCLWNNPQNIELVNEIIMKVVRTNCKDIEVNVIDEMDNKPTKNQAGEFRGQGTERNPFLIESDLDLYSIGNDKYREKEYYFKQVEDIDLSSMENWDPIDRFSGHYNGNNKKISNLKIDRKNLERAGLFGSISENSSVKNVRLENIDIKGDNSSFYSDFYAGGLVGYNKGTVYKNNIAGSINSSTSGVEACLYAGGLIGYNGGRVFKNHTTTNVSSSSSGSSDCYAGGLIGYNGGSVTNNYATGSVESSTLDYNSSPFAGGLIGYNEGLVAKNYATGAVKSSAKKEKSLYGGGLVGHSKEGVIADNVALNKSIVVAEKTKDKITYRVSAPNGDLENNYALESMEVNQEVINSSDPNGKEGKSISESLLSQNFFDRLDWDFEEVWIWDADKNRPLLRMKTDISNFNEDETETNKPTKDELIMQIKENIWLPGYEDV
jgi:MoxR-like ATPase